VNMKYTTGGNGKFTGPPMYFKNHIDPMNLTAYYPYKGDEGTLPALIEASTGADNQTSDKQPEFDFLYASLENITGSNPNVEFTFAHKMSKITFIFEDGNIGTDVRKITSYQIDGLILEGTFNPATGVCAANNVAPESLTMTTTGVEKGKQLPSLIVFPQATAGKTVTMKIKDSEKQDYACTLNFGDDGIVAGNNYQYTIKVSKTGLTVNSNITDWIDNRLASEAKSDDSDD
ncbi:MAG: fimbrillin family protein, partial [Prevotella sp.]|nr:fimbrillin family protein [Prevotella sp.]